MRRGIWALIAITVLSAGCRAAALPKMKVIGEVSPGEYEVYSSMTTFNSHIPDAAVGVISSTEYWATTVTPPVSALIYVPVVIGAGNPPSKSKLDDYLKAHRSDPELTIYEHVKIRSSISPW